MLPASVDGGFVRLVALVELVLLVALFALTARVDRRAKFLATVRWALKSSFPAEMS